jgi:hypothetical protein
MLCGYVVDSECYKYYCNENEDSNAAFIIDRSPLNWLGYPVLTVFIIPLLKLFIFRVHCLVHISRSYLFKTIKLIFFNKLTLQIN